MPFPILLFSPRVPRGSSCKSKIRSNTAVKSTTFETHHGSWGGYPTVCSWKTRTQNQGLTVRMVSVVSLQSIIRHIYIYECVCGCVSLVSITNQNVQDHSPGVSEHGEVPKIPPGTQIEMAISKKKRKWWPTSGFSPFPLIVKSNPSGLDSKLDQ